VDLLDAANLLSAGLYDSSSPAIWSQGDFNYDATVDVLDAADLLSTGLFDQGSYVDGMASGSTGVTAVPEPAVAASAGLLAGLAIAAKALRRR
jgi:hypothetical protein